MRLSTPRLIALSFVLLLAFLGAVYGYGDTVQGESFCGSPPCPFPAEQGEKGIVFGTSHMNASSLHWHDSNESGELVMATPEGGREKVAEVGVDDVFPNDFYLYKNWRYFDERTGRQEDVYVWMQVDQAANVTGGDSEGCPGSNGSENCDLLAYTSELASRELEGEVDGVQIATSKYWVVNPEDDICAFSLAEACLQSAGQGDAYVEVTNATFRVHELAVGYYDPNANKSLKLNDVTAEIRYGDAGGRGLGRGRAAENIYGTHDSFYHQTLSKEFQCLGNRASGSYGNIRAHCERYEDIGEVGRVPVNGLETVQTRGKYANPVVVAWPAESHGETHVIPHVENVRTENNVTMFDIQLDRWDEYEGTPRSHHEPQGHPLEVVNYMVMEEGNYTLVDGTEVEAGVDSGNMGSSSWTQVGFDSGFDAKPTLLVQGQTGGDYGCGAGCNTYDDSFTVRVRNLDSAGFEAKLQEQEAYTDGHLPQEDVGYVAWESGAGAQYLTRNYRTGTEHTSSRDDVVYHRLYEAGETPEAVGGVDSSYRIEFQRTYEDPVFLAHTTTSNDLDPGAVRYDNLTGTSVDVYVSEGKTLDGERSHDNESVSYLVFEGGHDEPFPLTNNTKHEGDSPWSECFSC